MDCYLCQAAGRKQVAHRILPGGKGVCKDHLSGMLDPGSVCAVSVLPAQAGIRPSAAAGVATMEISDRRSDPDRTIGVRKSDKEETMPKKIEINSEKLKTLHAQGLSDRDRGKTRLFRCDDRGKP